MSCEPDAPLPYEMLSYLDSLPEPHIVCDSGYRIRAANAAYQRIYGHSAGIIGQRERVAILKKRLAAMTDPRAAMLLTVCNKGDAGEMGQGAFDALVATTKTKIIEVSKDNGAAGKTATSDSTASR